MHRSGSTTRVSDELYAGMAAAGGGLLTPDHLLPRYDPQSAPTKKEAARARSAECAVHAIPVVLVACAVVLWFFSTPQIDVTSRGDAVVAGIENMATGEGYYSNGTDAVLQDAALPAEQSNREEVKGGKVGGQGDLVGKVPRFPL